MIKANPLGDCISMKDLEPIQIQLQFGAGDDKSTMEVKELNGDNVVEVFLEYRAEYLSKIGVK